MLTDINGKPVVLKLSKRRARKERQARKAAKRYRKAALKAQAKRYGSQGPASDVRIIDPVTGQQVGTVRKHKALPQQLEVRLIGRVPSRHDVHGPVQPGHLARR